MNHDHSNGGMGRHMLLMLICCLVPVGLIVAVSTFGLSLGPLQPLLPYVAALMCPLMMGMMIFMMMRGQNNTSTGGEHTHHVAAPRTPASKVIPETVTTQDKCH